MKITGFSIQMGSERTYTGNYASSEKREMYVKNAGSTGMLTGDSVSISRESYSKTRSEYGFRAASRSVVSIDGEKDKAGNTKSVIETMTRELTGKNVSLTSIYSKSSEKRSVPPLSRSVPSDGQSSVNMLNITRSYVYNQAESTSIGSSGTIQTSDGREIAFNLFLEMQRSVKKEGSDFTSGEARALTDPLVINFSGRPPELSDSVFTFDIDSDGTKDKLSSLAKGTGFLSIDINRDGKINNGKELFGPSTGNGFSELSAYDSNTDGWIDENDAAFSDLAIWTKDEKGEDTLIDLKSAGIGAIYTGYADSEFTLSGKTGETDAVMRRTGVYVKEDGEVQNIFQVDLAKHQTEEGTAVSSDNSNNRRTVEQQGNQAGGARAAMLQNIREQLEKMRESISKRMNQNAESNDEQNPFKNDVFDKLKSRLDDLMKFFDEKVKEGNTKRSSGRISGYA